MRQINAQPVARIGSSRRRDSICGQEALFAVAVTHTRAYRPQGRLVTCSRAPHIRMFMYAARSRRAARRDKDAAE